MDGVTFKGENSFILTFISMYRNYNDPRWVTSAQMQQNGWKFKRYKNGKSRGKNAGVLISYYTLTDRREQTPYDESWLNASDHRQKGKDDTNYYLNKKTYEVFCAEIIEGIPEWMPAKAKEDKPDKRADDLISYWSRNVCPIRIGEKAAKFDAVQRLISCPSPKDLSSYAEYYISILHEISHSLGWEQRPPWQLPNDADIDTIFSVFAREEVLAELSAEFLCLELGIHLPGETVSASVHFLCEHIKILFAYRNPPSVFDIVTQAEVHCRNILEHSSEPNNGGEG